MVRFADMLGGSETPEEKAQTDDPPQLEEPARPVEKAAHESPKDVLERLTQYATSARAADQVPAPPAAETPSPEPSPAPEDAGSTDELTPVGDDLLPHSKGRKGRT